MKLRFDSQLGEIKENTASGSPEHHCIYTNIEADENDSDGNRKPVTQISGYSNVEQLAN